jgi:hypothetical protein
VRQARTEAHAAAEAAFQERFAAALAHVRVEFNKQARSFCLHALRRLLRQRQQPRSTFQRR